MADPTPRRAKSRWEPWRKRYALISDIASPQRIGLLLAVALLALVGALGGLDAVEAVETPQTPVVAVGETIKAKPFEVTVRRARHFNELKPALYAQEGYRYLVVSLDVTLRNDRYVHALDLKTAVEVDAVGLKTVTYGGTSRPEDPVVLRGMDSLGLRTLQPGLTTSTIFVWQQEVSTPIPDTVTITLSAQTWRKSSLDSSWRWFDPTPVARVTLPLEALEVPR